MDKKFDVGTIDFAVYEDADEFVGIAQVTLPDRNQKTIQIEGAGIGGTVTFPVPGQYDAMEMAFEFKAFSKKVARMREHRMHTISLYIAQAAEDTVAGRVFTESVKIVLVVVPQGTTGGTVKPASSSDTKVKVAVRSIAIYIGGELVDEVDQLNRRDVVNGIDYGAEVRKALGQ